MNPQKTFSQKITDTGTLLRSTFNLFWLGGYELKKPTVKTSIYAGINTLFFYLAILSLLWFTHNPVYTIGIFLILISIWIILKVYGIFYFIRAKADQALIVHNHIKGIPITYEKAHEMNDEEVYKIRGIAFIDLLIKSSSAASQVKVNAGPQPSIGLSGIRAMILGIFFSFLSEVWDLVSNYMLPAVVIEKKPIREIVPNLKLLKNNIPGTLAGVFAIDFAGSIISVLFTWIYSATLAIFGILFFLLMGPGAVAGQKAFLICVVPTFIILMTVSIVSSVYSRIIDSVKTVYFSCFYTTLAYPEVIIAEYRQTVEDYLNYKPSGDQINLVTQQVTIT